MTLKVEVKQPCGAVTNVTVTPEALPALNTVVSVAKLFSDLKAHLDNTVQVWTCAEVFWEDSLAHLGSLTSEQH